MGFCSTPRNASSSGQHGSRDRELVHQRQPAQGRRPRDQQPQLGELALAGRLAGPAGIGSGQRGGLRLDLQPQLGSESRGAQEPQRVGGEASLADGAQDSRLQVLEAGERIDRGPAVERHGDGADR